MGTILKSPYSWFFRSTVSMYIHGIMSTEQPDVQRERRPSNSGQMRSACNACHQSKTKCSGGLPCMTCAMSHGRCTYSMRNRLGRPKGSKNKRISSQENRMNSRDETGHGNDRVPCRQRRQPRQQRSTSLGNVSIEDMSMDEHSEQPLGPELSSLFDAFGAEDEDNTFMASSAKELDPTMFSLDSTFLPLSPQTTFPFDDGMNASKANYGNGTLDISSSIDPPSYESAYIGPRIDTETGPGTHDYVPPEQPPCSCLQQHIRLVYHLEDLQYIPDNSLSISNILDGVRQAQGPWTSLTHCLQCQNPKEQEVFLLFAMSIRVLLYSAQAYYSCHQNSLQESSFSARQSASSSAASSVPVSVDGHELVGEEKNLVIELTIRNALQRIRSALIYLGKRTDECGLLWGDEITTRSIQLLECYNGNSLANLEADGIRSLLKSFQGTMQAMKDILWRNSRKNSDQNQ